MIFGILYDSTWYMMRQGTEVAEACHSDMDVDTEILYRLYHHHYVCHDKTGRWKCKIVEEFSRYG